jgi:excisionase family DNA binding protein
MQAFSFLSFLGRLAVVTTRSISQDSAPDLRKFAERAAESLARGGHLRLETDEESCELAGQEAQALAAILRVLGEGRAMEIAALPDEVTTGQAADLLGVSRPTVVKLVDAGELPSTRIGTHRRLRTADVLAYRERTRRERGAALDELSELSQELGLYDKP